MKKNSKKPIRTISLLARGSVGAALAKFLAGDKDVRVVSFLSDSPARAMRALFPKAREFSDVTGDAYKEHCRKEVDCILSIHCNVILPAAVLDAAPDAFNLHPGYLPHGRGYWPTYWAIIDKSPAGTSLHRMAQKVDRGPVIAQARVCVKPTDCGETLTRRVNEAEIALFRSVWPKLKRGRYKEAYAKGKGAYHDRAEGVAVRKLRLNAITTVGSLLDKLRAFTDSRFDGCYFEKDGKKIFVKLSLYEDPNA